MKLWLFSLVTAIILFMAFPSLTKAQADEPDTLWCKFTYPNEIRVVKFSHDGKYLASGGTDGVANIWDAETGNLVKSYPTILRTHFK
jgi:WD40 repeat protein